MPFVNEPNMWGQTSDVVAHASQDLGNLMTQLPMQKLQMANIVSEMQRRQQEGQMAQQESLARQGSSQREAQLFPLQQQMLQGRIGLLGEQSGLLDERTKLMLQQQAMLQQQNDQMRAYLEQNPGAIPKGIQPQFRQGGGAIYDAFTGQQAGATPRVLRQGEALTQGTGVQQPAGFNIPGLSAVSPYAPKTTNPNAASISALVHGMVSDPTLATNTPVLNAIMNLIGSRQQGQAPMQMPSPLNSQAPQQTNTTNYVWTPGGLVPK